MPAPKRVKAPERIEIDGKSYVLVRALAREKGFSCQGLMDRIERGQIVGAIKHKPCEKQQEVWYMPEGTEIRAKCERAMPNAEQTFPALHRNSEGVPSPTKTDESLPAVNCSDCPHRDKALKKCYGVTLNKQLVDGVEEFKNYSCHRIGRLINPLPEWLTKPEPKPYEGPGLKTTSDLPLPKLGPVKDMRYEKPTEDVHEKPEIAPVKPQNEQKAPERVQEEAENAKPIPSEKEAFRIVLMELENEEASLDEEAAEIEARFEDIAKRATKVKTAIEALKALEVKESA